MAEEALAAGALTLELGFPHAKPQEGAALAASHRLSLAAGVDTAQAFAFVPTVAGRHLHTPLVAVVQWPAIQAEDERRGFLYGLVEAGAAAVLAVGLPLWQLPAFLRPRSMAAVCKWRFPARPTPRANSATLPSATVPRASTCRAAARPARAGVRGCGRLLPPRGRRNEYPDCGRCRSQNAADVSEIVNTPRPGRGRGKPTGRTCDAGRMGRRVRPPAAGALEETSPCHPSFPCR